MTEFLDLVRHIGGQAGGTASAVGILLRVTVLLLAAMLVAFALRRSSAALRHLVWTLSLVGTLLIPLCYWVLPAWQWAILPQRQPSASVSQSPIAPVTEDSPPASPIAPLAKDVPAAIPLQPKYSRHPSVASAGESFEAPVTPPPRVTEHATAVPTPRPAWSWPVFFAVGWAFGTLLGFVWLGIGLVAAWYVAWRAKPAADADWHRLLRQLLEACGIRRAIAVRECPRVSVPMTWGLRRPVILVPAGSAAWPEPIKRSVLLHELGHIRRGDCLMLLLGRLACVAYWFHPLAWLAARQLRKTSEQAADDMVLSSHIAPPDYAEHLVGIAAQMRGLQLFGHVALPMASPSDLEGRVRAILDPRRNHRSLKRKTCYALMLLAMLLLIPCALLRLGYAVDKKVPEQPAAGPGEVSWGEPLHGLRTRLTAPDGPEYRQGQSCTLRVEMQNASEKPIALSTMARPNVLIKAEDAKGNWLGIPREAVGVSPWEGRKDALAPDAILRWEIPLASLRFIRQIAPGTDVKLRVEGPVQHVIPGKLPIELASNSTGMMFKDAFPAVLKAADLPEKWSKSMTFVYRHIPGLKGPEGRSALQIDGNGRAILVASRGQPNVPVVEGRTEATLSQQRLDRLAGLLRQQQTWNLEQFQEIANSDEAEIRLCLISGPASMVGDFPMHVAQRQPALAAIQREAESLMADVAAAAKPDATKTVSVDVLVVSPDGRPVTDAEVQAYDSYVALQTYRTDQHGVFRIPGKWLNADGHIYSLAARKGEAVGWCWLCGPFESSNVEKHAEGQPLKIALVPCDRTVEGKCLDREGRPMAKVPVRVILLRNAANARGETTYPECLGRGVSDAQGHYAIKVPEYQFCNVVAEHPDYVPVEASYRADSAGPKQIVLKEPAGMVRGRVVDSASGSPIRGAAILAQALIPRIGYAGFRMSVSDGNGEYLLTSMAPGLWNVLFGRFPEKPDWIAVAVESLAVKNGEAARADFRVAPGRLLSGQVIDAEKNVPLAGVSIGYYGPARPRSGAACMMVKTNAEGRFALHVPPGESYVYVAQEFRGKPSSRTLIVEAQDDPEPVVFRGILSKPVATTYAAAPIAKIEEVPRDRQPVQGPPTLSKAAPLARTESPGVVLPNDTSYTLQGTLRTAGGKPVPGAIIHVWSPAQVGYQETSRFVVQGGEFSSFLGIHFVDGQGRRQSEMEDQYYRNKIGRPWYLVVDAAGYARPKPIALIFGKEIKPLAIVLERPVYVSVRGRALDAEGQSLAKANVSVSLSTVDEAVEEPWGPEYLTDKDGRFVLKQVHVGNRFAVRIEKEHYVAAVSPRKLVENASPIDLGDLRLNAVEKPQATPDDKRPAPAEGTNASGPPKGGTTSAGPAAPLLTSFGTVVDPAGKPVAGAAVYLRERLNDGITREVRDRDLNDDILATTHTGEEGTFRFENIRTRPFIDDRDRRSKRKIVPWDVVVIARPYAIAWQHLTAERQSKSMTFKLSPDATITGRVTDEKGRAMPNADARVLEIRSLSPSYISPREQFGSDPETLELKYSRLAPAGKSDAQGNVLIAGLPRGVMLEVQVGHADVEPQSLHAATTDKPQPKIEGILGQAINMETREMIGVERTYESVYSMAFSVKLGPPLPRFAGRITAADSKKPLPQTLVDGCGTFSNWFRVTDKDGRFAVNWLRPRNRYLWIKAPEGSDYLDQFLVFDLPKEKEFDPPNEKQAVPLEIELTRGEILTGTVSDVETGKGLAGFGVSFDNRATRKHDGGEPILYRAKTDNAGRFRLTVPPGKGNVLISRPGDDPGWEFDGKSEKQLSGKETVRKVEVLAGKPHADLTLKIHHSRSVVGTVLDPAGRPAAGADVGLSSWFGDNEGDFHPVQTDAQGRFAFRRIPDHSPLNPTETVIAIDRGRRLRGHIQIPNVSPAASKEDVLTIRLVPTGVVRGRVLQGDKPIAGASVHLESVPGYELYSTQTDPSGQFEFPMVEACSEIESSVQASGQHTYLRRPTEVLPGPTREKSPGPVVGGHTLELKPFIFPTGYKSLGGVVTGPNGKPVEGLYVWVYARSDGHKIEVWPEAHTGADGHFLINQVPDVPVTLVAFGTPANGKLDLADLARKDAEPGQLDVRIVFDPKLAGGKK